MLTSLIHHNQLHPFKAIVAAAFDATDVLDRPVVGDEIQLSARGRDSEKR